MNEPLISVIVPIYTVEPYLRKCLDSIINQTYQNIELILVDDGSPDNCGSICDEYAARDSRIRVIHKENGGVSSARNTGLMKASGEWIGWVDSDDWIELDMYEYLLRHALEHDADIAVCGRYEQYCSHQIFRGWESEEVLDTVQALELLLKNDVMQSYLCDKLWRRSLFDGIIFPEGRTFEDNAVMHRLFMRARQVICLPEAKYNYLQRTGSIVNDKSLENQINHYRAEKQRLDEIYDQYPQFHELLTAQCMTSSIKIWCSYYKNPRAERKKFRADLKGIAAFAKVNCGPALQYMGFGIMGRTVLKLTKYSTWWAFAMAAFFSWIYSLKHGRAL